MIRVACTLNFLHCQRSSLHLPTLCLCLHTHVVHHIFCLVKHGDVTQLFTIPRYDLLLLAVISKISSRLIWQLVEQLDAPLHNYFKQNDCLNYFFCFRWLLIQFKRYVYSLSCPLVFFAIKFCNLKVFTGLKLKLSLYFKQ